MKLETPIFQSQIFQRSSETCWSSNQYNILAHNIRVIVFTRNKLNRYVIMSSIYTLCTRWWYVVLNNDTKQQHVLSHHIM